METGLLYSGDNVAFINYVLIKDSASSKLYIYMTSIYHKKINIDLKNISGKISNNLISNPNSKMWIFIGCIQKNNFPTW